MNSVYSATKFAIRGMTQSAAMDYGKYGITVNAYAPGVIETPLSKFPLIISAESTHRDTDMPRYAAQWHTSMSTTPLRAGSRKDRGRRR